MKQADIGEAEPKPGLRKRIAHKVGQWLIKRLQKRAEREWAEYWHSPKVSFGPLVPARSDRHKPQVYRSLVQIHFHPRAGEVN